MEDKIDLEHKERLRAYEDMQETMDTKEKLL